MIITKSILLKNINCFYKEFDNSYLDLIQDKISRMIKRSDTKIIIDETNDVLEENAYGICKPKQYRDRIFATWLDM